jgi:transcriptional regulator with XRE-family HTH domain
MDYDFGKTMTDLRKKAGLTQEEVARKLNVSPQAVSKWENNTSMPDVMLLSKIASLFNTSIDTLLGRDRVQVVSVQSKNKHDLDKLIFKINILSHDGDKVKINLPMALVVIALETGLTPQVDGKDILKQLDFKKIIALVEEGAIGRLVEIETKDGDKVEVVVE